jgi:hypothetical protein
MDNDLFILNNESGYVWTQANIPEDIQDIIQLEYDDRDQLVLFII